MSLFRNSYRIYCHENRYYRAELRYWWLPFFWFPFGGWTFDKEEAANNARNHADPNSPGNITNLGKLP